MLFLPYLCSNLPFHISSFQVICTFSNIFFRRTFPTYFLQRKKIYFRTPSVCLISYLLIPATFCCTHFPILFKNCSNIFIPLMVNCLMKSYAFSSFAFSVRFSAFNTSFSLQTLILVFKVQYLFKVYLLFVRPSSVEKCHLA